MEENVGTILAVDKDPAVLDLIQTTLSEAGMLVETCSDGTEAKNRIGKNSISLLLAGTNLKKVGALTLARLLEAHRTPIIILTNGKQTSVGGYRTLRKPLTADSLLHAVWAALDHGQSHLLSNRLTSLEGSVSSGIQSVHDKLDGLKTGQTSLGLTLTDHLSEDSKAFVEVRRGLETVAESCAKAVTASSTAVQNSTATQSALGRVGLFKVAKRDWKLISAIAGALFSMVAFAWGMVGGRVTESVNQFATLPELGEKVANVDKALVEIREEQRASRMEQRALGQDVRMLVRDVRHAALAGPQPSPSPAGVAHWR